MIKFPKTYPTSDLPIVVFEQAKELVVLDDVLPSILRREGWACGTCFYIQFMGGNEKHLKLLAMALYVVSEVDESLHTNESNPYQPITKMITNRKAEIVGKWQYFDKEKPDTLDEMTRIVDDASKRSADIKLEIKWNPGKKVHELKLGDDVLYANADKKKVEAARVGV